MASLIKSVKAFGEKATGQKINGNTLVGVMKDMGQKMTGKEINGNSLLDIIDATTEDYTGGGAKVVTELPEVGDEHTVYELQETKVADFPWLLTEIDESNAYPTMNIYQAVVVENEEDVAQEYLAMPNDFTESDNDNHCVVFVKSTGNVYDCCMVEVEVVGEESPYEFSKTQLELITDKTGNKYYKVGKILFIILSDFDYSVDNTGERPILNGIGHYLDGAEFEYGYDNDLVPLVLTNGVDKKIGLNQNLVGGIDLTNAPVQIPEGDLVTKIDLSILQEHFTEGPVFAPQSTHTEISYWIYSNKTWTNTEDIGKPVEQEVVYGELLEGPTFNTDSKFISPYTNEQICNYVAEGKPVILRYHNKYMGENQFMYVYINGYVPAEMDDEWVNQGLYYENFTCDEYNTTDRIRYNVESDYFYYDWGE